MHWQAYTRTCACAHTRKQMHTHAHTLSCTFLLDLADAARRTSTSPVAQLASRTAFSESSSADSRPGPICGAERRTQRQWVCMLVCVHVCKSVCCTGWHVVG